MRKRAVESLGWPTEPPITPRKHRAIEGAGDSSGQLYKSQEESKRNSKEVIYISDDNHGQDLEVRRAKKKIAAKDSSSRKNSCGVDGRTDNYSPEEDVLLCQVYMKTCRNPFIRVRRLDDQFWARVEKSYNKSRPWGLKDRSRISVETRIKTIEEALMKFHGCIRQMERFYRNGAPYEDIMVKAKMLYKIDTEDKSDFKFDHAWNVMKDFEKFNDGSRSIRRPPGVKKAKLLAKKYNAKRIEESKMHMEKMNALKAQAMKHVAAMKALRETREENKILLQNVSSIKDPQYRAFVEAEQARIIKKRTVENPTFVLID